jgi:hypothetical protein
MSVFSTRPMDSMAVSPLWFVLNGLGLLLGANTMRAAKGPAQCVLATALVPLAGALLLGGSIRTMYDSIGICTCDSMGDVQSYDDLGDDFGDCEDEEDQEAEQACRLKVYLEHLEETLSHSCFSLYLDMCGECEQPDWDQEQDVVLQEVSTMFSCLDTCGCGEGDECEVGDVASEIQDAQTAYAECVQLCDHNSCLDVSSGIVLSCTLAWFGLIFVLWSLQDAIAGVKDIEGKAPDVRGGAIRSMLESNFGFIFLYRGRMSFLIFAGFLAIGNCRLSVPETCDDDNLDEALLDLDCKYADSEGTVHNAEEEACTAEDLEDIFCRKDKLYHWHGLIGGLAACAVALLHVPVVCSSKSRCFTTAALFSCMATVMWRAT